MDWNTRIKKTSKKSGTVNERPLQDDLIKIKINLKPVNFKKFQNALYKNREALVSSIFEKSDHRYYDMNNRLRKSDIYSTLSPNYFRNRVVSEFYTLINNKSSKKRSYTLKQIINIASYLNPDRIRQDFVNDTGYDALVDAYRIFNDPQIYTWTYRPSKEESLFDCIFKEALERVILKEIKKSKKVQIDKSDEAVMDFYKKTLSFLSKKEKGVCPFLRIYSDIVNLKFVSITNRVRGDINPFSNMYSKLFDLTFLDDEGVFQIELITVAVDPDLLMTKIKSMKIRLSKLLSKCDHYKKAFEPTGKTRIVKGKRIIIESLFEPGFGYNIEMNNCPFTNDYRSNKEHIREIGKMAGKLREEIASFN